MKSFVKIGRNKIYTKKINGFLTLDLIHKNISDISNVKGLEKLSNLHTLCLDDNFITEIKGFENLTQLKNIFLFNNPVYNSLVERFGEKHCDNAQLIVKFCQNQKYNLQMSKLDLKQKLEKLSSLFGMSKSLNVDIVASLMGMNKVEIIDFLMENREILGDIKIKDNFINISSSEDVNEFIGQLDKQFKSWEKREKSKYGKIEKIEKNMKISFSEPPKVLKKFKKEYIIMDQCQYCKEIITYKKFRCISCEKEFCGSHRLPENHNCSRY